MKIIFDIFKMLRFFWGRDQTRDWQTGSSKNSQAAARSRFTDQIRKYNKEK